MPQSPDLSITAWRLERGWQVEDLCEQATLAEAWGFSGFWLPENHFGDERAIPAPLMLLSAVAACTQRLRLGTTSYLLPFRNPILAAEEVAVLDQLSGGRVILGVGRGMQKPLFNVFGVESKRKRALFEANLSTMMDAWRGESLGEAVRVEAGEERRTARRVRAYSEIGPGEIGLLVDSYGLLSLAVDSTSAAELLGIAPGDTVKLDEPVDGGSGDAAPTTPIELRRTRS